MKTPLDVWREKALNALDNSIAHWERMASNTQGHDEWPVESDCALCDAFTDGEGNCCACPVALHGFDGCSLSPYRNAYIAFKRRNQGRPYNQSALDAEVSFLKDIKEKVLKGDIQNDE